MATMVKEKRKEKKKAKEKSSSRSSTSRELPQVDLETPLSKEICDETASTSLTNPEEHVVPKKVVTDQDSKIGQKLVEETYSTSSISIDTGLIKSKSNLKTKSPNQEIVEDVPKKSLYDSPQSVETTSTVTKINDITEVLTSDIEGSYKELSNRLEMMEMPENAIEISQEREFELLHPDAYLNTQSFEQGAPLEVENAVPSAPCFEEIPQSVPYQEVIIDSKPRVQCMPIEDVMRLYSGGEMEEVRTMSEREEEIVESGPMSGPEHPLVDLLSTFRSSLMAVERERIQLANGFADEEKCRNTLWKIEKRSVYVSEKCSCGSNVDLRATYEHAEFVRDRLPIAKMKLEGLLRDVQDSYCHHQHAALLAYYQIEELISETIKSNKSVIREALSLVLGSLRLSASAPDALASALQRWAAALASALVDHRDLRQLLFILHHLFRQSRSVRWASRVIQVRVDIESPQRVLALLELLLARSRLDTAQECTEEADEVWEEVDKHGDGGAVSEGTLRERDLLALLYAFPLRDLVARILLSTHNDIKQARPPEWGDESGGRGVLRACYGVRALLRVLRRATSEHRGYARLARALREVAAHALHGLACLHLCSSPYYAPELREKLSSELEASFFAGFELFESRDVHQLPATLLADTTAQHYCLTYIEQLHEAAVLSCEERVRIVSQAAVDRVFDHELARIILEFLLQTGLRKKPAQCKRSCDVTARDCLPQLLAAHPYLHTIALHILADMNMVEPLDATFVKCVHVDKWRPNTGEVRALLEDWSRRCPHLLQHLLMLIDFTPYSGVPLDVQLSIGSWLCTYVRGTCTTGSSVPDGWWAVLRRLRTHRSSWMLPIDAPPPDEVPTDLFSMAYALLSSSWGHCIPLICSEGVSALCKLSTQRPRDAVHCLGSIMLVMAHSPESVALTPQFNEVFTSLLSSGPSLMARALGRGGVPGAEMLLRLILSQLDNEHTPRGSVLSAWLHGLWRASLPSSALNVADTVACATRLWPQLDAYANSLLQEENSKEHINHAVRNAGIAPLLCECVLRMCHSQHETLVHFGYARLLNTLHLQRTAGHKIHVNNALQQVAPNVSSEELVIYRAANAALVAPMTHPSHLTLWRLLLHLYLQRPPDYMSETTPPVGPLFFSGLIKSRTLSQIKKRLQETITYHHNEVATLKATKSIDTNQPQSTKATTNSSSVLVDNNLLPVLTIVDLTGESSSASDSEDSAGESGSSKREQSAVESPDPKKNLFSLISYHLGAERMVGEYLCWLEEGDKVRAMPHHADIARFIPEHALEAAWKRVATRPVPSEDFDSFPLPTPRPPPDTTPPKTPFYAAVDNILRIKDRSRIRRKRTEIKSPVEDVDLKDPRVLVSLVDTHLKDIEKLAQEWCSEVSRISTLDNKLWELVVALRVNRPIPPVRKQCPNKCKPVTLVIPAREWCVSVDAERGVRDNRTSAGTALRRVARPRPHAAKTAAALLSLARGVRSSESCSRVIQRAWSCAGTIHCGQCAPARAVITTLVSDLAERWICDNGRICSQLLYSWGKRGSSTLQQTLCGALLSPRRLASTDWPVVYTALLDSHLPSHTVFSYLSKFEMFRWAESAEFSQRRDVLEALLRSVQRYGPTPAAEHQMLIEILGVHTAVVMTSQDLPAHVTSCARISLENKLPHTHWTHIVRAVDVKAAAVPFDQLGHLLRELGVMWWEVRTGVRNSGSLHLAAYAPYIARLLHALQRAFVASGTRLSYEPERVAWYAWSALRESWGAWISPHSGSLPLLPSTADNEQYTPMVRHFVDSVHQIMLDCPGTEIHLLQQIFEWCVQTYVSVQTVPSMTGTPNVASMTQESRVQASALLAELAKLPWSEHQWFYGNSLQVALQMSTSTDHELTSWCSTTWRDTSADTLLKDAGDQIVPRLASLLYLFTGTLLPHTQQILDMACQLPWHRLPERALEEALERFYVLHHNVARPYHDLPQFRVILHACELVVPTDGVVQQSVCSRHKRATGVSAWLRGATSPALASHVSVHTTSLLNTIAALATPLSSSSGELEELISRALVVMCIEPAASVALPVWVKWVREASPQLVLASVSGAAAVTAFEYCATLGDAAVNSAIQKHNLSWNEVASRWSSSPWREVVPFLSRTRLYVAYSCVCVLQQEHKQVHDTLQVLLTADINFIENEVILAVWICYVSRMSHEHEAGRVVLARWGEDERRSLLSRVTMQQQHDKPTPLHRILCRYALYIQSPDETSRRAFETAFTSTLGANSDVSTWTIAPQPNKLVLLAIRLFPKHENYFQHELQQA